MLESRGIATTVIGLVRHHMEQTRPPRGLFVPFQLGRPLGEPGDAGFQHRVLGQALALLERDDGPVILEDFPDQAQGWVNTPGWTPPTLTARARPATPVEWQAAFAAELTELAPAWEAAQARHGRSTVGLAGLAPAAWPAFCAQFLAGELPHTDTQRTPGLALRFLADDIKALYGEAAQAAPPFPAPRQVDAWFWRQTIAGQLLIALRGVAEGSENGALKTMGTRFFVPVPWLPK